jgi:protein TonB
MRRATLGAGGAQLSGQDRERRLLEYAIVISIALHVLAFAALQRLTPRAEPAVAIPEQISARLVEPTPVATAVVSPAAPPLPAAPAPTTDPVPQPEPTTVPNPEPKVGARPEPKTAPRSERRAAAPKATPRPRPAPKPAARAEPKPEADDAPASPAPRDAPAPASPPDAVAPAALPPALASSAPTVDADVLARYRLQVIGAARRYKRYPRSAMDNQWEGAAVVTMVIGANGRIREMTISHSSGHEVLDRQAIDMFRKAKPLVPIPAALRGREFRVMLKAIYSLREPEA